MIDTLNDLLEDVRFGLLELGKHEAKKSWGYQYCTTENDLKLKEYEKIVHLLRNQELNGGVCICKEDLDHIISGARKVLGPECKTNPKSFTRGEVDPNWVLNNPDCVRYETWADALKAQCSKIGIDLKVALKKCSDVNIDVKVVEKKICNIVLGDFTVEEKQCKVDIDLKVELENCKVEFETKIKPLNCDVDLDAFVTLKDCGVSLDLILKQLKCGATVNTILKGVDSCFPDSDADAKTLSITCPNQFVDTSGWVIGDPPAAQLPIGIEDISCPPNVPNGCDFALCLETISVTNNCGCTLDGDSADFFTGDIFDGWDGYEIIGDIITYTVTLPVTCGETDGAFIITATYDNTNLVICSPPPSYQSTACSDVTWVVTDPCGNTATCKKRMWLFSNC